MTHGSLFSGIGGFDLAAEHAGFQNVFQVENNPWCLRVLEKNFPNVVRYGDIIRFNAKPYAGQIDLLTGGFPCQPFSFASPNRKGKTDNRYLWPEMFRVIDEIRPRFVIAENVPGIIRLALDQVLFDLESIGYTVWPFIIPACAKDAPHRRDRVWIIACQKHFKTNTQRRNTTQTRKIPRDTENLVFSDTVGNGRKQHKSPSFSNQTSRHGRRTPESRSYWQDKPGICRVADGIPYRMDRIRGLGNAVVPEVVVELVFKLLEIE